MSAKAECTIVGFMVGNMTLTATSVVVPYVAILSKERTMVLPTGIIWKWAFEAESTTQRFIYHPELQLHGYDQRFVE